MHRGAGKATLQSSNLLSISAIRLDRAKNATPRAELWNVLQSSIVRPILAVVCMREICMGKFLKVRGHSPRRYSLISRVNSEISKFSRFLFFFVVINWFEISKNLRMFVVYGIYELYEESVRSCIFYILQHSLKEVVFCLLIWRFVESHLQVWVLKYLGYVFAFKIDPSNSINPRNFESLQKIFREEINSFHSDRAEILFPISTNFRTLCCFHIFQFS